MCKLIFLLSSLLLSGISAMPCDRCSRQQPAILRIISHGRGPETQWDLWIVSAAAASVVLTLYLSVKWLLTPGEISPDHIKNQILNSL